MTAEKCAGFIISGAVFHILMINFYHTSRILYTSHHNAKTGHFAPFQGRFFM